MRRTSPGTPSPTRTRRRLAVNRYFERRVFEKMLDLDEGGFQ
ncbi:hypothetical protein [Rhodococcus jostii]